MANRKIVGVRRNVRIRTDLTTESELKQMAKTAGIPIEFYSGAGEEAGYMSNNGTQRIIKMNRNKFKEMTTFYLHGVEITMENKHAFDLPTSKAIFYHEMGHVMFSTKNTLGHKVLKGIKDQMATGDYSFPTAYAAVTNEWESMMEYYAFFRLKPGRLKKSQPKIYKLMKQWDQEYKQKGTN
jgi:hypothetical protein